MGRILKYGWRVLVVALFLTAICILSQLLLVELPGFRESEGAVALVLATLLIANTCIVAVLAYPTARSRWSGMQLVSVIFVVYFGVHTFVYQNRELLARPDQAEPFEAALVTAHGFLVALVLAFALTLMMGRLRRKESIRESARLHLPLREWLWKLGLSILLAVSLRLAADRFLWPQLGELPPRVTALVPGYRLLLAGGRALLLLAFVMPVIKMMRGGRLETAITVGLILSVLGAVATFKMPGVLSADRVRLCCAVEEVAANLIYGFAIGFLFSREPVRPANGSNQA